MLCLSLLWKLFHSFLSLPPNYTTQLSLNSTYVLGVLQHDLNSSLMLEPPYIAPEEHAHIAPQLSILWLYVEVFCGEVMAPWKSANDISQRDWVRNTKLVLDRVKAIGRCRMRDQMCWTNLQRDLVICWRPCKYQRQNWTIGVSLILDHADSLLSEIPCHIFVFPDHSRMVQQVFPNLHDINFLRSKLRMKIKSLNHLLNNSEEGKSNCLEGLLWWASALRHWTHTGLSLSNNLIITCRQSHYRHTSWFWCLVFLPL